MVMEPVKAVGMLSGGLDSMLAVLMMHELGIDVIACNVSTPFCACDSGAEGGARGRALRLTRSLSVPLVRVNAGPAFVDLVKAPRHGYGRALNPCQDCRVNSFRLGAQVMREHGARFLFTGEVLGQRPMSQRRHQLHRIENEAGLPGLVLRPLSAKLLPPTVPERRGWVDRERLLDLAGRSRHRQLELAESLGLADPPCAGGGCLLTEQGFALKLQDAFRHAQDGRDQLQLLRVGRHFRLSATCKLILGRSEAENRVLTAHPAKRRLFMVASGIPGPVALLDDRAGEPAPECVQRGAALMLRYANATPDRDYPVIFGANPWRPDRLTVARAATDPDVRRARLADRLEWRGRARDQDWLVCRPDDVTREVVE